MNRKLVMIALALLAVCMITPCVYAQAETWHYTRKFVESETQTDLFDLPPEYVYTKVNMTITFTTKYSSVYQEVLDANGNMHGSGKVLIEESWQGEAWFWDDTLQEWVFGQRLSRTFKRIYAFNELILDSERQTGKELRLDREKFEVEGIYPQNGESFTVDLMTIRHWMVKWVNGELQFLNYWEIEKGIGIPYV